MQKDSQNSFFLILKGNRTKRKNIFEKLNHICFVSWAVIINPKIQVFLTSLARKKIEQINFFVIFFSQIGLKSRIMGLEIAVLEKDLEKMKNEPKIAMLILSKISAVQRCFRGNQRCSAQILSSEIFFQRCSEIFRQWTALNEN